MTITARMVMIGFCGLLLLCMWAFWLYGLTLVIDGAATNNTEAWVIVGGVVLGGPILTGSVLVLMSLWQNNPSVTIGRKARLPEAKVVR